MGWSIPILRVAGIQLRIHITFLLLIAWIAFAYYSQGGSSAAVDGVLFILLLFACVVLHEFGTLWRGKLSESTRLTSRLLPIGGVARLERIPDEPCRN
jgi:stage IV sporulation protein FB